MVFCNTCGHEIQQDGSKFCPKCGIHLPQAAPPTATTPSTVSLPVAALAPETSGLAIGSLICGILFFIFPSAIAAVVMGHISRAEIRRSGGRKTGEGMALAGLVLGYIGVSIIPILIIAAIAIPNLLQSKMSANEAAAIAMLEALTESSVMYSTTHGGFPHTISDLRPSAGSPASSSSAADLIDAVLASGVKNGYSFTYAVVASDPSGNVLSYSITASPVTPGATGRRYFFINQTGVIHAEMGRAATADSPPNI